MKSDPNDAPAARQQGHAADTFEVDAETRRVLLAAIAQCEEGRTTPLAEVLEELRRRE
jgi:hypothetical protein